MIRALILPQMLFLLLSSVGFTVSMDDELKTKIIHHIDRYVDSLEEYMDNQACLPIIKLFKTKKYRYVTRKIARLEKLKRKINDDEISCEEALITITDKLRPYPESYGDRFLRRARMSLVKEIYEMRQLQEKDVAAKIKRECCICLGEAKTHFVVYGCGHANVCKECQREGRLGKCPTCREEITHKCKNRLCLLCGNNPATTLHRGCDHLDTCEACLDERRHHSCLVCGSRTRCETIKLFY
ncbi:MAG TPA: RING-HC finger protein [Myxococcota bacterium]|nr:RING-HC finger protein [Myxococcota bacterium]